MDTCIITLLKHRTCWICRERKASEIGEKGTHWLLWAGLGGPTQCPEYVAASLREQGVLKQEGDGSDAEEDSHNLPCHFGQSARTQSRLQVRTLASLKFLGAQISKLYSKLKSKNIHIACSSSSDPHLRLYMWGGREGGSRSKDKKWCALEAKLASRAYAR